VRVVLDNKSRLSPDSQLARTTSEAPVIVIGNADLRAVLKELADKYANSVEQGLEKLR